MNGFIIFLLWKIMGLLLDLTVSPPSSKGHNICKEKRPQPKCKKNPLINSIHVYEEGLIDFESCSEFNAILWWCIKLS